MMFINIYVSDTKNKNEYYGKTQKPLRQLFKIKTEFLVWLMIYQILETNYFNRNYNITEESNNLWLDDLNENVTWFYTTFLI